MKIYTVLVVFFCLLSQILAGPVIYNAKGLRERPAGCYDGTIDVAICCQDKKDSYVRFPDTKYCNKYYECMNGEAVRWNCPTGLKYSIHSEQCVKAELSECPGDGNNPGTTTTTTTFIPTKTSTTTFSPTTTSTSTSTFIPTTTSTPTTTFIPSTNSTSTTTFIPTKTSTTTFSPTTTSTSTTTFIPTTTSTSTTAFIPTKTSTTNSIPTTTSTSTTTFIPTTLSPSTPEGDHCTPEPISHQCISGEIPADLCCKDVKNYYKLNLANAKNCFSYYTCINEHAVLRECPEGLHWSSETDRCEWPENSNCKVSDDGNGQSVECLNGKIDAAICCKNVPETIDVFLQNNADCHTYFQCVHGVPMVKPCPSNLWWSMTANGCGWIQNATCTW